TGEQYRAVRAHVSARDSHFVPSRVCRRFGLVPGMALLLPGLRGRKSPELPLLTGARRGATACSGGRGLPITTDVPGGVAEASSQLPAQRSGSDCCAAVASPL